MTTMTPILRLFLLFVGVEFSGARRPGMSTRSMEREDSVTVAFNNISFLQRFHSIRATSRQTPRCSLDSQQSVEAYQVP